MPDGKVQIYDSIINTAVFHTERILRNMTPPPINVEAIWLFHIIFEFFSH